MTGEPATPATPLEQLAEVRAVVDQHLPAMMANDNALATRTVALEGSVSEVKTAVAEQGAKLDALMVILQKLSNNSAPLPAAPSPDAVPVAAVASAASTAPAMAVAGAAASPVGDETAYGGNEKIPPPKFDGTGTYEAVRAWFSDVGKWVAFMRARKHSEMAIVLLLDRAFTGEAETYRVLQNATGQWPTTPEGIANTVSERFRPKTAALTKRRELQQFRFQSGGTMEQHVAAFAALAVTVEQASAAELYSCFLASVPTNVMTLLGDGRLNPPSEDQNLRWSFMEQVYTRAIDIWGVLQLSNGFNMLAVHDRVQDDRMQVDAVQGRRGHGNRGQGRSRRGQNGGRGGRGGRGRDDRQDDEYEVETRRCYRCDEVGHLRHNCPRRPNANVAVFNHQCTCRFDCSSRSGQVVPVGGTSPNFVHTDVNDGGTTQLLHVAVDVDVDDAREPLIV
ncbi:hypothetical protein AMAG_19295, partial [Allomyces macrogynus ATCC 38327]